MAKKSDKKAADKSQEKSAEIKKKKAKAGTAESPEEHEHVPAQAENFEHTLKRLISERDEKRSAKAGIYR